MTEAAGWLLWIDVPGTGAASERAAFGPGARAAQDTAMSAARLELDRLGVAGSRVRSSYTSLRSGEGGWRIGVLVRVDAELAASTREAVGRAVLAARPDLALEWSPLERPVLGEPALAERAS